MDWQEVIDRLIGSTEDVVQDFDEDGPVEGMYWHRGQIKRADGKLMEAWVLKSWLDSGEQFGLIFKWGKEWLSQAMVDWAKSGKGIRAKFFPYRYRLRVQCPGDIHQGEMF